MLKRIAHRLRPRLKFANAIAVLALFIALGGTSLGDPVAHAGKTLTAKVKQALSLGKKADRNSRKALSLARAADRNAKAALAKAGLPGPAGAPGKAGTDGGALGYAKVEYCPSTCPDQSTPGWFVDDEGSHAVDNMANFSHPATGVFCFTNLLFQARSVVAITGPSATLYALQGRPGTIDDPIGSPCSPVGGPLNNAVVEVRDLEGTPGALIDPDQSVEFFVLFN